jgi:hypothetical protein
MRLFPACAMTAPPGLPRWPAAGRRRRGCRVMITGQGKGERGGRTYCAVPGNVAGGNAVTASPRFDPQAAPVPPGGRRPRASASQCGFPKVSSGVNGAPFSPQPELDDLGAIAHSPSIVAACKNSAGIRARADSTCKVRGSRYVNADTGPSAVRQMDPNPACAWPRATARPTISPQVRGRAKAPTGSPQTKRHYAVLGGTVATIAIRLADQRQCG